MSAAFAPADSQRAAASLLAFWAAGRRSRARVRRAAKRNESYNAFGAKAGVLSAEASAEGMPADTMKKAWRVAGEYTEEQIRGWCALVRAKRSRFGPTHLIRLLAVRSRAARDRLTRAAIQEGWSTAELQRAIQATNGRRAGVGNRPRLPTTRRRLIASLLALTEKWERWCEAAAGKPALADVADVLDESLVAVREVKKRVAPMLPSYARGGRKAGPRAKPP